MHVPSFKGIAWKHEKPVRINMGSGKHTPPLVCNIIIIIRAVSLLV